MTSTVTHVDLSANTAIGTSEGQADSSMVAVLDTARLSSACSNHVRPRARAAEMRGLLSRDARSEEIDGAGMPPHVEKESVAAAMITDRSRTDERLILTLPARARNDCPGRRFS